MGETQTFRLQHTLRHDLSYIFSSDTKKKWFFFFFFLRTCICHLPLAIWEAGRKSQAKNSSRTKSQRENWNFSLKMGFCCTETTLAFMKWEGLHFPLTSSSSQPEGHLSRWPSFLGLPSPTQHLLSRPQRKTLRKQWTFAFTNITTWEK